MKHFNNILDYNFTSSIEGELDKIANGNLVWHSVVDKVYKNIHPIVLQLRSDKTNIEKYELEPLNSSKQNPIDVIRIIKEKSKNEIRAKYLFSKDETYITGITGGMTEQKINNNIRYRLTLKPINQIASILVESLTLVFEDPNIAEKISSNKIISSCTVKNFSPSIN